MQQATQLNAVESWIDFEVNGSLNFNLMDINSTRIFHGTLKLLTEIGIFSLRV